MEESPLRLVGLSASGRLTPRTGDGEWTSKETASLNADDPKVLEVIRLATIEAQCSEKVRVGPASG